MQVAKREGGQLLQGALLLELLNRRFGDAQPLVDHQELEQALIAATNFDDETATQIVACALDEPALESTRLAVMSSESRPVPRYRLTVFCGIATQRVQISKLRHRFRLNLAEQTTRMCSPMPLWT